MKVKFPGDGAYYDATAQEIEKVSSTARSVTPASTASSTTTTSANGPLRGETSKPARRSRRRSRNRSATRRRRRRRSSSKSFVAYRTADVVANLMDAEALGLTLELVLQRERLRQPAGDDR